MCGIYLMTSYIGPLLVKHFLNVVKLSFLDETKHSLVLFLCNYLYALPLVTVSRRKNIFEKHHYGTGD
jgi:hypothetical protein